MAALTAAELAKAWAEVWHEAPSSWCETSILFESLWGGPRPTYREHLDRYRMNVFGRVLTRTQMFRWNQKVYMQKPPKPVRLP